MTTAVNNRQNDDLTDETLSFNDNCVTPAIAQVDAPADLNKGIMELVPDQDEQAGETKIGAGKEVSG